MFFVLIFQILFDVRILSLLTKFVWDYCFTFCAPEVNGARWYISGHAPWSDAYE